MVAAGDAFYSLIIAAAASAVDDPMVSGDAPRPPTRKITA
jgi:hypothetical protein